MTSSALILMQHPPMRLLAASLMAMACLMYYSRSKKGCGKNECASGAGSASGPPCDVLVNPSWAPRLASLRELSLANCGLRELPKSIGKCANLTRLDLAGNDLADLPSSFAKLEKLEILFILGSRRMKSVPRVLAKMTSLTRLGLRSNGLERLEGSRLPPNLVHAIFTDNAISRIDDDAYAKFARVRKLMLANNRLASFTGGEEAGPPPGVLRRPFSSSRVQGPWDREADDGRPPHRLQTSQDRGEERRARGPFRRPERDRLTSRESWQRRVRSGGL